jgi:hypothetical protein
MARKTLFSQLFALWRDDVGVTQQMIANRLSNHGFPYDRTTISKYETGDRQPDGQFMAAMEVIYRIDNEEIKRWIRAIHHDFMSDIIESYKRTKAALGG